MRSCGCTYWGLALSVVVFTKLRIACFAGPSFHEGSGSAPVLATGWPDDGVFGAVWPAGGAAGVGLLVQPARIKDRESNNAERNIARSFMSLSPDLAAPAAYSISGITSSAAPTVVSQLRPAAQSLAVSKSRPKSPGRANRRAAKSRNFQPVRAASWFPRLCP